MMKYLIEIIIAVLIILLNFNGFAAEKKNTVLTLNECINIALQNNTSILSSEEDKKKVTADYKVARAQLWYPNIDFTLRSSQFPKVYTAKELSKQTLNDQIWSNLASANPPIGPYLYYTDDNPLNKKSTGFTTSQYYNLGFTASLAATISVFSEKKLKTIEGALSMTKLAKLQNRKTIIDAIYNIKRTYYTLIMARENLIIREKLVKYQEERLKIMQILYKNVQRQLYDLSKTKVDLSDAKLELEKAKNTERVAREDIFRTMGITDPGMDFELEDTKKMPKVKHTVNELNKFGVLHSPDLNIVKMQKEIKRISILAEKGGHYPEIDVQLSGGFENGTFFNKPEGIYKYAKRSGDPGWKEQFAFAFVAKFPIYSGGAVSARVDAAQAEYNKLVLQERDAYKTLFTAIESSYTQTKELSEQVKISQQHIKNAENHLLMTTKMYESGTVTMLDMHDANISLINARMGHSKLQYDYLMTIAKLSSIVDLGEDTLCKK